MANILFLKTMSKRGEQSDRNQRGGWLKLSPLWTNCLEILHWRNFCQFILIFVQAKATQTQSLLIYVYWLLLYMCSGPGTSLEPSLNEMLTVFHSEQKWAKNQITVYQFIFLIQHSVHPMSHTRVCIINSVFFQDSLSKV